MVADEEVSEGSHVGLGVWAMEEPGCSQWGKAMGRFDIVKVYVFPKTICKIMVECDVTI